MANTIGYGQGAVNNTIGYGQGAKVGSSFSNTQSIEFDGVDDTINIGTPTNLRFNRLDAFSVSAWVKRDSENNLCIISNQLAPSTDYRGYYFAIRTNQQLIFIFRHSLSERLVWYGTQVLNTDWNHVVFTYDGSATTGGGQFYVNGSADTTTSNGSLTLTAESSDTILHKWSKQC